MSWPTKPQANASHLGTGPDTVAAALRRPTYEVIPIKGVDEAVAELPREVRLTVTASPAHGIDRTIAVAGRLAGMGFRVVPHLAARYVTDHDHLAKIVARLAEYDIRDVFVIGGDYAEPLGDFASAAELLEALAAEEALFEEVGIAGYPEGHPTIATETLTAEIQRKRPYATYMASQLCFDAETIRDWAHGQGHTLPIEVGVPGVASLTKLMHVSTKIGVGQSLKFLRSNRGLTRALLSQQGTYHPEHLMNQLEPELADSASRVRGFHIYTFNEVARTERWRQEKLAELAAA